MPNPNNEEHVLVIPRSLFDSLGSFQGLKNEPAHFLDAILDPANNFFMPRSAAEEDPGHKQIIPYCLFTHKNRILRYVRGSKGGEKRLAAKSSIGIGGHVNRSDANGNHLGKNTYNQGVEREILEELHFNGTFTQNIVALLNDDSNPVGQVHLGVVHLVRLLDDNPMVKANEAAITKLAFLTPEELQKNKDQLETWSQICLSSVDIWL